MRIDIVAVTLGVCLSVGKAEAREAFTLFNHLKIEPKLMKAIKKCENSKMSTGESRNCLKDLAIKEEEKLEKSIQEFEKDIDKIEKKKQKEVSTEIDTAKRFSQKARGTFNDFVNTVCEVEGVNEYGWGVVIRLLLISVLSRSR